MDQPETVGEAVGESVDELRQRLSGMKKKLADRRKTMGFEGEPRKKTEGLIDGTFMSAVFGGALFVIIFVSVYAFYNLYNAVIKKMSRQHEEL